jgi:hypothetical protein
MHVSRADRPEDILRTLNQSAAVLQPQLNNTQ